VTDLADAIAASVTKLGRVGRAYPIYLEPPAGEEVVAATDIFATANLRHYFHRAIAEWTDHPEEENLRAAASRFMRRYCGSVATAALLPLANGVAVDVALRRVSVVVRSEMPMGVVLDLDDAALATSPERPTTWPIAGVSTTSAHELRNRALRSLFGDNLGPAIERIYHHVHLAPKVLWGTAAEQIDLLYENAVDHHDEPWVRAMADDREAILFAEQVPGVHGPNPMRDLLSWETVADPQFPRPLQVRNACCICYLIPGRDTYCRSCGRLEPDERLAIWQAWKASVSG
jgi:ferric iron reductase protein FhuF